MKQDLCFTLALVSEYRPLCSLIRNWALFHSAIHTILSFWLILISARTEIDLIPSL